jgi:hypothetical protein
VYNDKGPGTNDDVIEIYDGGVLRTSLDAGLVAGIVIKGGTLRDTLEVEYRTGIVAPGGGLSHGFIPLGITFQGNDPTGGGDDTLKVDFDGATAFNSIIADMTTPAAPNNTALAGLLSFDTGAGATRKTGTILFSGVGEVGGDRHRCLRCDCALGREGENGSHEDPYAGRWARLRHLPQADGIGRLGRHPRGHHSGASRRASPTWPTTTR